MELNYEKLKNTSYYGRCMEIACKWNQIYEENNGYIEEEKYEEFKMDCYKSEAKIHDVLKYMDNGITIYY